MRTVYVTYGYGSNLANCFSKVRVPDGESVTAFIQEQIGNKYAFVYNQTSWVQEGVSQQMQYGLTEVPLQPQVSEVSQ